MTDGEAAFIVMADEARTLAKFLTTEHHEALVVISLYDRKTDRVFCASWCPSQTRDERVALVDEAQWLLRQIDTSEK